MNRLGSWFMLVSGSLIVLACYGLAGYAAVQAVLTDKPLSWGPSFTIGVLGGTLVLKDLGHWAARVRRGTK